MLKEEGVGTLLVNWREAFHILETYSFADLEGEPIEAGLSPEAATAIARKMAMRRAKP